MDVLTKMFNEGKACILKMNPVNAYLGPYLEEAFADAIRQDFLAVVYGDAEEGAYLANHPALTRSTSPGRTAPSTRSCGDRRDRSGRPGRRSGGRCCKSRSRPSWETSRR